MAKETTYIAARLHEIVAECENITNYYAGNYAVLDDGRPFSLGVLSGVVREDDGSPRTITYFAHPWEGTPGRVVLLEEPQDVDAALTRARELRDALESKVRSAHNARYSEIERKIAELRQELAQLSADAPKPAPPQESAPSVIDEGILFPEEFRESVPPQESAVQEDVKDGERRRRFSHHVRYPGYTTDCALVKLTGKSYRMVSEAITALNIRRYFLGKKFSNHYHVLNEDVPAIAEWCTAK